MVSVGVRGELFSSNSGRGSKTRALGSGLGIPQPEVEGLLRKVEGREGDHRRTCTPPLQKKRRQVQSGCRDDRKKVGLISGQKNESRFKGKDTLIKGKGTHEEQTRRVSWRLGFRNGPAGVPFRVLRCFVR